MTRNYDEFVDKFKPRHTSDDTHTQPNVYAAVLDWCAARYGIDRRDVVRPFFPGGDYAHHEYPDGCVVVDNPPFSILSQIVRFYLARKVPFFLFAPSLTSLGHARHPGVCAIFTNSDITFDNGAVVRTAFLTSLEGPDVVAVSAPDLGDAIAAADKDNRAIGKRKVTPLALPVELLTGARMQYLAAHHTPLTLRRSEAVFVRKLDNYPAGIFGGGFLLSERAAAERAAATRAAAKRAAAKRAAAECAAAIRVELSPRERAIVEWIGKGSGRDGTPCRPRRSRLATPKPGRDGTPCRPRRSRGDRPTTPQTSQTPPEAQG